MYKMPAYYNEFFKGKPVWLKPALIAIGLILVILVLYFVIKSVSKALGLSNKNVRIDASSIKFEEGQGEVVNFDPTEWVNELHHVLTNAYWAGWGIGERCDAYQRVSEKLNDNQLRVVNTAYEAAHGKTIREAMRNTWDSGCFIVGTMGTDYGDLLKTRLERMGI